MGLLDDAIREHLELKRQHGADPAEVERQEREALGAPRQAEFAATPDESAAAAPFDAGEPVAGDEPSAADEPVAGDEPLAADEPGAADEPVVADESAAAGEPAPIPLEGDEPDESLAEVQAPVDGGEEREPFDIEALDDERDEVPAEESLDRPREDAEEPGEDVLEDTPDFLQETPEHDRLWFEQKPPRDFDWDK